MGILSSIFNPATGTPSNGAAPPPNFNQQSQAAPGAPIQPVAPTAEELAAAAKAANPTSALDEFIPLWQNATTPDGKPLPPTVDPLSQPIYNFDQAKLAESASRMDFMSGVDPAKVQSALSGNAVDFAAVINQAVQSAVIGVTTQSGRLINDAVINNNRRITNSIPSQVRQTQLLESTQDHPVFSHAAVQPLVNALKQTEFQKNPNKPVAEIEATVSNYLLGLVAAMQASSPEATKVAATKAAAEPDYSWVYNN
jgi:hypothetical protein